MSAISGVSSLQSIQSAQANALAKTDSMKLKLAEATGFNPAGVSFADRLGESLNSVAESQNKAAQSVKDYELGREQDLSKVMVEQQISSLGFQLTLNVRNKALSAYKEIMNMPV